MKVGYADNGYASQRNIINIVQGHTYKNVYDINRAILIASRINKNFVELPIIQYADRRFSFNDLNLNQVDILHFFNTISFGKRPWITTFETIVPRFSSTLSCHMGKNCSYSTLIHDKQVLRALEALCSDSCKTLIALSECNLNMQRDLLTHFPQFRSEIERKLIHLHPPQKAIVANCEHKRPSINEQIHFMFVGRLFFRKGGMEILETFQEAKNYDGHNIKLTIISSMSIDEYATEKARKDLDIAQNIIQSNKDWIDYYDHVPNQKTLELMKLAHIGLLPTHADTYGYSVLEFQAAGCPVISTNSRALPEINNNEIGWLIEVPTNRLGEAIYTSEEERNEISRSIKVGLKRIIAEIMENRESVFHKANAALKHIKDHHSPEEYSKRLGEIYDGALQ